MEGTILSIASVKSSLAIVVPCSVEKEKRGGNRQMKYVDIHEKMVETATKHLIGNVRTFLKHWSREKFRIEGYELCSGERREAVTGIFEDGN